MRKRTPLNPNTIISGLRVINLIGAGSFGLTYLVEDLNSSLKFVMKEFYPDLIAYRDSNRSIRPLDGRGNAEDFEYCKRKSMTEAKNLAGIDHPNILRIERFFLANNTIYILTHLIDGVVLSEAIDKGTINLDKEFKNILLGLVSGLEFCHRMRVIHGDLKPANIMLRRDFSPVIIDFGASIRIGSENPGGSAQMLTDGYAPPESYSFRMTPSTASDIYSLGAVLYRLVTRKHLPSARQRLLMDDASLIIGELEGHDRLINQEIRTFISNAISLDIRARPSLTLQLISTMTQARSIYPVELNPAKANPSSVEVHSNISENHSSFVGWVLPTAGVLAGLGVLIGLWNINDKPGGSANVQEDFAIPMKDLKASGGNIDPSKDSNLDILFKATTGRFIDERYAQIHGVSEEYNQIIAEIETSIAKASRSDGVEKRPNGDLLIRGVNLGMFAGFKTGIYADQDCKEFISEHMECLVGSGNSILCSRSSKAGSNINQVCITGLIKP